MFTGDKVKIRLKRTSQDQKVRVFVGQVISMTNDWLKVEGKFYTIAKGETLPRVDDKTRTLGIPRENISVIRVLPNDLNLGDLLCTIQDNRLMIHIPDKQPVSISE